MNSKVSSRFSVRTIALLAMVIALNFVFARVLSIDTQFLKINGSFLTHTLLGVLFSPAVNAVTFGLMDVVGFMLKPTGPFFPGFTLTAIIVGALYGFFYYRKEITLKRVILANLVITLLDSLLFTPINLMILYQVPFWALIPARLLKVSIMIPIQVAFIYILLPRVLKIDFLKRFID
ncbi:MAG: folate family ECF transporter S component [Streptococcaceae bacterium]|jgi:ECF transporter S component (folate family)|nr:folate family ECF transporter S component [Streptococcaceae bacterium]